MGGQTRMNFWTSQSSGNQGVQTLKGIQRCNLSDESTVFGHNVRNDWQILGEGGHSWKSRGDRVRKRHTQQRHSSLSNSDKWNQLLRWAMMLRRSTTSRNKPRVFSCGENCWELIHPRFLFKGAFEGRVAQSTWIWRSLRYMGCLQELQWVTPWSSPLGWVAAGIVSGDGRLFTEDGGRGFEWGRGTCRKRSSRGLWLRRLLAISSADIMMQGS